MNMMAKPSAGFRNVTVAQGETRVSSDPEVVLVTVLGSCVAACLFDPVAKVGGINHYLLASGTATDSASLQRYGVHAMELLINNMMAQGAMRKRMKARIYGGATMRSSFRDIGGENIAFARQFLRAEGIPLVGEDVGDNCARRVQFRAALGLARCRSVQNTAAMAPPAKKSTPIMPPVSTGDVELF